MPLVSKDKIDLLGIFTNFWRYLFRIYDTLIRIERLAKEIKNKMATQEERLQAVAASVARVQEGVDRIQELLASLKADNPALEDEISAIETAVAALGADVDWSLRTTR